MSRCFPFPPPGYEKKFKAEHLDLLTKDKVREKKHKKEKKETEKREHKEKREKDRSKDKHKDKKDRKEKRKERKKHKDIDKKRTSEDNRAETWAEGHNEFNVREILQKEGRKDSKFAEELGRRTRDDGAANRLAGNLTSSQKIEGAVAPSPLEMERVSNKKVFPVHNIGSAQKNYGSGPPVENFTNPLQRAENISTSTSMENERIKIHEKPPFVINTEPNRNHGISLPDGISWVVNRKTEYSIAGMDKEKSGENNSIPNSIVSPPKRGQHGARCVASSSTSSRTNNLMGLAVENHSFCSKPEDMVNSSVHSRMDGPCAALSIEKERIKGREMFAHQFSSEQRTKATVGRPVEKDRYQKFDWKDTDEIRKDEYRKGVKDSDNEKKSRPKHTDKYINDKKEMEKIVKIENEQRNFVKKDQIGTLSSKPLAPHKENTVGIKDVESMKWSDVNTNGSIHENDARPSKMPRLMPSSQLMDPPFSFPLKDGAMNNSKKPDRTLDNIEKKINGSGKSHQLQAIDGQPPAARSSLENGVVALSLPHPDSKYLPHLYSVPKMEEISEIDDMNWLFNCCDSRQKPKQKHEDEHAPQVWAEALRIDSVDVLALPYVVPF